MSAMAVPPLQKKRDRLGRAARRQGRGRAPPAGWRLKSPRSPAPPGRPRPPFSSASTAGLAGLAGLGHDGVDAVHQRLGGGRVVARDVVQAHVAKAAPFPEQWATVSLFQLPDHGCTSRGSDSVVERPPPAVCDKRRAGARRWQTGAPPGLRRAAREGVGG